MAFYPGPGLGGHCIPIDPFYLSWKAKQSGFDPRFIELAGHINGAHAATMSSSKVAKRSTPSARPSTARTILIAGVAYKRDIDDMRESPALDVMGLLRDKGANVAYVDPYVPEVHAREWSGRVDVTGEDPYHLLRPLRLHRHRHRSQDVRLRRDGRARPISSLTRETRSTNRRHTSSSWARRILRKDWSASSPASASLYDALFQWQSVVLGVGTVRVVCVRGLSTAARDLGRVLVRARSRSGSHPLALRPSLLSSPLATRAIGCLIAIVNLLEAGYPTPVEIIVVSDGSTDRTASARRVFSRSRSLHRTVRAVASRARSTRGWRRRDGDIIVFADARQRFARNAFVALAANFADPAVGAVTGELVLDCEAGSVAADSEVAEGVGLYWQYENGFGVRKAASGPRSAPRVPSTRSAARCGGLCRRKRSWTMC